MLFDDDDDIVASANSFEESHSFKANAKETHITD